MGYFTKNSIGPATGPLPALSREAIEAVLDGWGAHYGIDSDGDLGGYWDGHLFYFLRSGGDGTALTIRGRWNREIRVDERQTVLELINTWHVEKIWPKAYVRTEEEDLGVYTEVSTALGSGVTHAQLGDLMSCALSTSLQLFDLLDENFPAAAAAARAAENGAGSGAAADDA